MPTLVFSLLLSHVPVGAVLVVAGTAPDPHAHRGGLGLLALIVALALLGAALNHLRRAFMPIAELVRMIAAAGLVALLIVAAAVLVVVSLFMRG
jgi:hypothetical protein